MKHLKATPVGRTVTCTATLQEVNGNRLLFHVEARDDDGKIVFLAQFITQITDVVIGLFAVVIFVVFDVVSSTKYDVIMNVSFVNMGGNNIRIFPL